MIPHLFENSFGFLCLCVQVVGGSIGLSVGVQSGQHHHVGIRKPQLGKLVRSGSSHAEGLASVLCQAREEADRVPMLGR